MPQSPGSQIIPGNPCGILQGLAYFELQILKALNKKFAALRRMAELLEQLGDISSFLPAIGNLIPVISVDLSLYTQLQQRCPFLNLPPASNESIADLQAKLNAAYGLLMRQLLNHPWLRLDRAQAMMNDFQNKLNFPYGSDYLQCLNAVCAAVGAAGSLLSNVSQINIAKELDTFSTNFVKNEGQVLTKSMQTKRDEGIQVYNSVRDLRSDSVQDYTSITAGGAVNPQQPPLAVGHATVPNFVFLPDGKVRFPTE